MKNPDRNTTNNIHTTKKRVTFKGKSFMESGVKNVACHFSSFCLIFSSIRNELVSIEGSSLLSSRLNVYQRTMKVHNLAYTCLFIECDV